MVFSGSDAEQQMWYSVHSNETHETGLILLWEDTVLFLRSLLWWKIKELHRVSEQTVPSFMLHHTDSWFDLVWAILFSLHS